jgi:LysR family transcriptional regulator, regulator for bpeEF and oprC
MDVFGAMKVFVRVVESGSFTKAADALQLPPPSVSRSVQLLEEHLGTRLLNRTTRKISITEDGQAYYERSVKVLGDVDDMEASLSSAKISPRGKIKVSLPALMANNIVIPALPEFVGAYPELEVEMVLTDRHIDIIEEGVDCVIRVGELADSGLIAKRIGAFNGVIVAAPSYLEKYGVPTTLEDLENHFAVNYVSSTSGRVQSWDFLVDGKIESIYMKGHVALNDATCYLACGLAGLGIMKGSLYSLEQYIARGALLEVLADCPSPLRPISILYPPNRHLSRKVRLFIDWMAEVYARVPALQAKN